MEDVSHWSVDAEPIVRWEAAVGGSLADDTVGARGVAGGLGRVGFRWVDGAEGQHQETYTRIAAHVGRTLREVVVGDYLGADVRARALFDLSGAHRDPRYLIGAAAAFANVLGDGPFRIPSILGLLLPEVGVALARDRKPSPYLAIGFPVGWLLTSDVAIEITPSVLGILPTEAAPTREAHVWLDVALVFR